MDGMGIVVQEYFYDMKGFVQLSHPEVGFIPNQR